MHVACVLTLSTADPTSTSTWLDELRTQVGETPAQAAAIVTNTSSVQTPAPRPLSLLISCLVYEDKKYIRQALRNLLYLTQPTTNVVVHFSALTKPFLRNHTDMTWWMDGIPPKQPGRVLVNPERRMTKHATGTVLLQHLSNLGFARAQGLISSHFLLHASTSRFISPGVEAFIFAHNFAVVEQKGWLNVDIWNHRQCQQHGFRGIVKGSAGPFMCSLAHEFSQRGDLECPRPQHGVKGSRGRGDRCNRLFFSQHEGYFLPTSVAYAALDFFKKTPAMNLSSGKPSSVMTLYDWLPTFEAPGGQAAEEICLQTFVGYDPTTKKVYGQSRPLPAVDKHWTLRTAKVGICQALAILEARDHRKCQYPFSIKRWSNAPQTGMVENDIWLECIGRRGQENILQWKGAARHWQAWAEVARGCFELADNRTHFASKRNHPKCDRSEAGKRQVINDVYKGDAYGRQCEV
jgi:hypothetical protein